MFELFINILLSLLLFCTFSDFLVLLILFYYLFVHLGIVTIPSISFALPIQSKIFCNIISSDISGWVFCCNFTRSLCALFFIMTHCSTILASTFSKATCLKSFATSIVPLLVFKFLIFGFCWVSCFALLSCVPWNLFDKLRSIFLLWHNSII